jgi:hypothetical protein
LAAGFFCVPACAQIVFDMQLEMALHLVGKLALAGLFVEESAKPYEQSAQPSHW